MSMMSPDFQAPPPAMIVRVTRPRVTAARSHCEPPDNVGALAIPFIPAH